mmetsp:Transcript_21361/g.46333  ORF Transcript_21361/g.46333 Transcript_21361/m.46333 type:complete len:181 (-) Transcript_21361:223-765(-)|eukprot:CAMPEP_0168786062 /NCGR_PEP_ID=MMETSP0725-20121227/11079_1 /TAXON_ID=265536 /ORGANISM="Amphiprora sp., Strain CCMP467" /LENGTH=180 /DNA_ID=CAMNT_0008836201 /DNA_START=92 /DNA_END=634 /DNA_ORIENTATION=-
MTETEASYQKAPELEAEGVVVSGKRGKICCGACCDMRRATIVVNIVNLCFLGVALMGMIAALSVSSNLDKYSDDALFDDEFESDLNDLKGLGIVGIFVVLVLAIGHALGLYGAVSYKPWMVMTSFVFYCLSTIFALVRLDPFCIMYALFAYPHYFLWEEIRAGIMTPDNYPNEIHSCCCV